MLTVHWLLELQLGTDTSQSVCAYHMDGRPNMAQASLGLWTCAAQKIVCKWVNITFHFPSDLFFLLAAFNCLGYRILLPATGKDLLNIFLQKCYVYLLFGLK